MQPKKIKLIIFDLDGTLVNAYNAITHSFNVTMRSFGYPPQQAGVIRRAVGWGDRNLLKPFVRERDLDAMLESYRRHHAVSLVRKSRLFPGVKRLLARLRKKGLRLAVATNRPTRFSHILIRHLGIRPFFSVVLCGDKLKHIKPHPQILTTIMRRLRVRPQETVFVGDMFIDAQTGTAAGVITVMVTTGSSTRQELAKEKPWRIISRVTQLGALLKDCSV
ncbi:MAG TPA: HAD-IA family hydrolase [Candidatus Omnitrophota bacterium]|nr:HAD-IA family hydrolase [Candidatus Omnitrophota bacterium]